MSDQQLAPWGALTLRASLGVMWLAHGLLKLLVFSVPGFAQFLGSLGLPPVLAGPVIAAEIVGGVLILAGVYGRWVSLALMPVMIGAASVHIGNGWLFSAPNGGWEYPAFLIAASVAHFLIGDGKFAVTQGSPFEILARRASPV